MQGPVRRVSRRLRLAARVLRRTDPRIARRYLAAAREPKLHLGCGGHLLDGWLNADLRPRFADVMRIDAARPFPFPDGTFRYVYSEYMLGSLALREARSMLSECFRVLAPGGRVRIATTDLAFLIRLYGSERSALQERYVRWAAGRRMARCRHGLCRGALPPHGAGAAGEPGGEGRPGLDVHRGVGQHLGAAGESGGEEQPGRPVAPGVFLNHHLHSDQARFVYDAPVLRGMLKNAGFANVVRCEIDGSDDSALRGLANEGRMPEGFLRLECLTLEGTRPPGAARREAWRSRWRRRTVQAFRHRAEEGAGAVDPAPSTSRPPGAARRKDGPAPPSRRRQGGAGARSPGAARRKV